MTKEQEEVFEKVNKIRIDFFDSKYKEIHTNDELEEKYEALCEVLAMLKEKDKEIEKYKKLYQETLEQAAMISHNSLYKNKIISDLKYALLDMVMQFANRVKVKESGYALDTMGLSSLELAFDVLGFDNPYSIYEAEEKHRVLAKEYFDWRRKK